MLTQDIDNKTTRTERDVYYSFVRELRINCFSSKTIESYLYYTHSLANFANKNPQRISYWGFVTQWIEIELI